MSVLLTPALNLEQSNPEVFEGSMSSISLPDCPHYFGGNQALLFVKRLIVFSFNQCHCLVCISLVMGKARLCKTLKHLNSSAGMVLSYNTYRLYSNSRSGALEDVVFVG